MSAPLGMAARRSFAWVLAIGIVFILFATAQAAQVTLAWDANDPAPDGYRLYQRTEGSTYDYATPAWSGPTTSASLDNLVDNTTYFYVVRAYAGTTESGDSNEVSFRSEPPAPLTYTITASAGAYGEISPAGATTVNAGEGQVYTITPFAGFHVADVLVDGVSVGAVSSYTFNAVGADHTISATFAVNTYTISSSCGPNGTISPSGSTSLVHGGSQTYSMSPASGYHVGNVTVDGVSVGAVTSYTFRTVSGNHTISATFAVNTYTISSSCGPNGTISPSGSTSVVHGDSQTYSMSPASGYHVSNVTVDGVSVGAVTSYNFRTISSNHTIGATFAVNTYTISASAGQGGSIEPAGQVTVNSGASQAFTIRADSGYGVGAVTIDGQDVGAVESYTFNTVSGNHAIGVTFVQSNQPPTADAGPDQSVDEAMEVTLSGRNCVDLDDGIATFAWQQTQGTPVALSDPTAAETSFIAPDVDVQGQALVFELTVTDHSGAVATDSCIVNVSWVNEAPTAQAGADQTVTEGRVVALDGSNSVDPDNGIALYQWRQIQGPVVALSDSTAVRPTFTAPDVDLQGMSLLFELTVTDGGGLQDTDRCIVTVGWTNTQPVADAGPDQQVVEGQEVYLDGSNSSDPDDGIVAYQWRQTNGLPVVLSDATAVQPMFVAPNVGPEGATLTFQLTVTDQGGLQHDDTCMVTISRENVAPTADAGPDQTVSESVPVQLDGSASSDPDDGISAYRWHQISGPAVTLSDAQAASPTFQAPDVGPEGASLTFQLTVIDYSGLQRQDDCLVNVTWQNVPPVAAAGEDQEATAGIAVTLDGSASWDGDDGIGTYRWRQVSGTSVTLENTTSAVTRFTAPVVTTDTFLEFELTVKDSGGLQSVDRCRVVVHEAAPVIDTTAPEVAITSPGASFYMIRTSKIALKGVASDNQQIVRVVWKNDRGGSGQAIGTTAWQIPEIKLSRWFNTITVTAYDAAGNQQSARLLVFAGIWR